MDDGMLIYQPGERIGMPRSGFLAIPLVSIDAVETERSVASVWVRAKVRGASYDLARVEIPKGEAGDDEGVEAAAIASEIAALLRTVFA